MIKGDERVRVLEPRSRESWNRDRWHRAWPAIDGTVRGPRSMAPCVATARDSGLFFDDLHEQIDINGAGGRVTVVGCSRFGGFRCPCVRRASGVRGRDRWHRAWPAVSDRSNVALRGLCCDFGQNSSEPRCGRSLRPIVFSTLVSYRAGRCLRT